jgi:hypothetical protein
MNCAITTCTRKTTNWYFKTLDFKRRDFWKSTGEILREKSTGKRVRKKSTGKKSTVKKNTRKKIREKIRQKLVQTWNTMKRCKSRHFRRIWRETWLNIGVNSAIRTRFTTDNAVSISPRHERPGWRVGDTHWELKKRYHNRTLNTYSKLLVLGGAGYHFQA